jgi:UPF0755 protein
MDKKGDKVMNPPLMPTKKRTAGPVIGFVALLLAVVMTMGAIFYGQMGPAVPGSSEEKLFIIEHGAATGKIAADLQKEGLIKNAQTFLLYSRLTGKIDKFKSGQYLISPSFNVPQIVDLLVKGKVATITFTIPEGYHLRQIADVFVKAGISTEEEFWRVVKDGNFNYPFLKDLPRNERRLEGYLFPETYIIPKGMKTEQVIDLMLRQFDQVYKKLPSNKSNLTMHEVVTLASIVEGESRLDAERPLIASVFLNRLKINMKLDSDATVQYLFDKRKERVLYKDLEIDSPYNTYRNRGLPPGPIGSPGEASLRAVLVPAQSNYLYFVAKKDGSGQHVFAATHDEHIRNKQRLGY